MGVKGRVHKKERESLLKNGYSWCTKCQASKKISYFNKDRTTWFGLEYICKTCSIKKTQKRREEYPEKVKEIRRNSRNKKADYYNKQSKKWKETNRNLVRQYKRNKYKEDPLYKLQVACRGIVRRMFKSINNTKNKNTNKILGYSPKDLKEHLEKQFKDGMNWDNYGEWHIDHIIPISSATNLEEGIKLSKLENLQPLWGVDNIRKGNKF